MVDVESDGPIPGDYSMVCFGAVVVEPSLEKTFYGKLKPISDKWIPEALAVSGFSREDRALSKGPVGAALAANHLSRIATNAPSNSPTV